MITVLPENQLAYIGLAITLVTGAMSGVAAFLELFQVMQDKPNLFNWTVRAINLVLSFGVVCACEATLGVFDLHHWLAYILAATTVTGTSHVLYTIATARSRAKLRDAHTFIDMLSPRAATPVTPVDGRNDQKQPA